MIRATLKWDFLRDAWVAVFDDNSDVFGVGDTPEEAVKSLQREANKHDLWPNGVRPW